jgi:hypothetical protein
MALMHTMSLRLIRLRPASRIPIHAPSPAPRQFTTSLAQHSRLRQPGEPTGPNEPPTHTTAPRSKSPLKVWPILFILGGGTFLFKQIVDQRKGEYDAANKPVAGHSPSRP